ncbi:hypothetical protein PEX1_046020 [Penicillium expansum]|uniref:Uncharacterized protein n=1 Tax=Penicillium expansum TaxID=27334 RepID=A0A0A2K8U5_PENEN|nr:hypothetical protein PEX2_008710 [Penicillium expansum]KGO37029.1 hypothetical protein PEXP_008290 [Penicillium expansum]KGO51304.1 hypothetical protein PEX2_008710 [Penicillium expansum]KGO64257.1 hypothetical protein PEX1_046020 [Penicillium expansum]
MNGDSGESPMPSPRKVAARSHRNSQKGKNGPAVTPRAYHFSRGIGEYGETLV